MNILVVVSTAAAGAAMAGIAGACQRRGQSYSFFVTGKGALSLGDLNTGEPKLSDPNLESALDASVRALVCEHSWGKYFPDRPAPIKAGSQTDHSAMMAEADHVISL